MRFPSNLSIKNRLIAIILTVTLISVGLTTLSISVIGVYNLKEKMLKDAVLTASIVGERNKFAIKFGRQDVVAANMEVFKLRPAVSRSCIYDHEGDVFAFYPMDSDKAGTKPLPAVLPLSERCPKQGTIISGYSGKHLEVLRPVQIKGEKVGSIYLQHDLRDINEYVKEQLITAAMVILAVCLIAYVLAMRLQQGISNPILSLAQTAKTVSVHNDYSIRVDTPKESSGEFSKEIQTLYNAFNDMIGEIEGREKVLQQQNAELEIARQEAVSANIAKSSFLASISHELRTPLNAIIGFSSIIKDQLFGPVDGKYLEYTSDIHESGVHLLEIINDILDLSKAEAGKLKLDMEEFDVARALKKCKTILGERAEAGGVSMAVNHSETMPFLIADRVRFIQVMLNVMSNAIKFTDIGGRVEVRVDYRDMGDGRHCFNLDVEDTGIGMSADDIKHAFESFGQVDSGLDRKFEGTGLGLPLTKKLMDLHKGSISIDSEPKKGTTVHLQFISDPANLHKTL